MRKYFNFTIAQISSCLDNLESGSPDYVECLSELKHRNSKKAKILLEKYERVVTTIKAIETAPTLVRNGKAADTELSKRLSCLIESIEKIVNQQSIQFSTLSTSDFQERHIFGLNSLEDEEKVLSEFGWDMHSPSLLRHEFLLKKIAQRNVIISYFIWRMNCRSQGYAAQSAKDFVLTPKVAEKLTPVETEAVLAYINQKANVGPKFSTSPPKKTSIQIKEKIPVHYLPGCAPPKRKTPYEVWQEQRREEESLKQWVADEPDRRLRYNDIWDEMAELNRATDSYRNVLSSLTTDELKARWQSMEWESEMEMNILKAALRSRIL